MRSCQEAEEYILSIPKFAGKHTLEDTRRLLARVGGDMNIPTLHPLSNKTERK